MLNVSSSDYEAIPVIGILLTLIIGLLLAIWPLPAEIKWLRPEFSCLLIFYWINRLPFRLGLIFAWSVGLLFDLVVSETIGQRALALTVVAYCIVVFHSFIKRSGILGEVIFMLAIMLVYLLLFCWISAMTGKLNWSIDLVLPAFATALCWPLFGRLLARFYG